MLNWPADAVMIVAAYAGEERREHMEGVVACECRMCGRTLHADSYTIRFAENLPNRLGRPIRFFCSGCCVLHDGRQLNELYDHRGRKANGA